MGADKKQLEPFIQLRLFGLYCCRVGHCLCLVCDDQTGIFAGLVDASVLGHGQKPGLGFVGDAAFGPRIQSSHKGIGKCVFGGDDVARPAGQHRYQFAVSGAGDIFRPRLSVRPAHTLPMAEARISSLP